MPRVQGAVGLQVQGPEAHLPREPLHAADERAAVESDLTTGGTRCHFKKPRRRGGVTPYAIHFWSRFSFLEHTVRSLKKEDEEPQQQHMQQNEGILPRMPCSFE